MTPAALQITDLKVDFPGFARTVQAVRGVSLKIEPGENSFGAVMRGLDLAAPLDEPTVNSIRFRRRGRGFWPSPG